MTFKSHAQKRRYEQLVKEGKMKQKDFDRMLKDAEGLELPEHVIKPPKKK